jgi:hypothetical protein
MKPIFISAKIGTFHARRGEAGQGQENNVTEIAKRKLREAA